MTEPVNALADGLRDVAKWIQSRDPLATNYLYCLQAADALSPVRAPEVEALVATVLQDVAELPDRTSPDDWPEAMLVTHDELELILRRNLSRLSPVVEPARLYAINLAKALHAKHYPEVRHWKPLPDLIGLLTQIDNMTSGLSPLSPVRAPEACVEAETYRQMHELAKELGYPSILEALEALSALPTHGDELRGVLEALTPSAETKAAYIGEFSFNLEHEGYDEDGEPLEGTKRVPVPWTTIKEIMAAIKARAALARTDEQDKVI